MPRLPMRRLALLRAVQDDLAPGAALEPPGRRSALRRSLHVGTPRPGTLLSLTAVPISMVRICAAQHQGEVIRSAAFPAAAFPLALLCRFYGPRSELSRDLIDNALEPRGAREEVGQEVCRLVSDPTSRVDEQSQPRLPEPQLVSLGHRVRRPCEERRRDQEEAQGKVRGHGTRPVEPRVALQARRQSRDCAEIHPELGVLRLQGTVAGEQSGDGRDCAHRGIDHLHLRPIGTGRSDKPLPRRRHDRQQFEHHVCPLQQIFPYLGQLSDPVQRYQARVLQGGVVLAGLEEAEQFPQARPLDEAGENFQELVSREVGGLAERPADRVTGREGRVIAVRFFAAEWRGVSKLVQLLPHCVANCGRHRTRNLSLSRFFFFLFSPQQSRGGLFGVAESQYTANLCA